MYQAYDNIRRQRQIFAFLIKIYYQNAKIRTIKKEKKQEKKIQPYGAC